MQKLFSYPIEVDGLSSSVKKYQITASAKDLVYLTEVLKVPAVKSCTAEIWLKHNRRDHTLDVTGKVKAELELTSVISLENFDKVYEGDFALHYDTKATYKDIRDMEPEFDDDVPDIVEDGKIDLGDIIIEQVALMIEDYPRKDGEVFVFESEFDAETTEAMNPFNVLKKLKK